MPRPTLSDLQANYREGEDLDREVFQEMRSNIRLVSGDHYAKKNARFFDRIRENKNIPEDQKLRLTKNHIQKITKAYHNAIISHSPSTIITPQNEKELKDQKASELNSSVWNFTKKQGDFNAKLDQLAKDYVDIGECAVKIFFDPNMGSLVGFNAKMVPGPVNEDGSAGEMVPEIDAQGALVPSETAIFTGGLCFDRIYGFNLLRAPQAKSMKESPYLTYRKMVSIADLKIMVGPEDEEKLKFIQQSAEDVFTVFDGASGNYSEVKGMAMVRETYYRPCPEYPLGAWYIWTDHGILFDDGGEGLPFGVFPIEYEGFDEIQTTPRHRSIIKVARPYQAEINRSFSKIAETQITSDDKVYIQNGTKIGAGGKLPGIRAVTYSGEAPITQLGRSGEQYLPYGTQQIQEMYEVCNVYEEAEHITGATDPMMAIFKSMVNKKKFVPYAKKFEGFGVRVTEKSLKLQKGYLQDNALIPILGRSEIVNIPEFKSTEDICYQVKVEPIGDDIHTQMGKHITFQSILQYVGGSLDKDSIGMMIKQMPFITKDSAFGDLTLDYDSVTNDILALDRGKWRPAEPDDNHAYYIKRLSARMKQADFEYLDPQIQDMYRKKKMQHEQIKAQQAKAIQSAKDGFIPTTGYLVKITNFLIPNPEDPSKTTYLSLPYDSLKWLKEKLDTQGMAQEDLLKMNESSLAEMAGMLLNRGGRPMPGQPPLMIGR